MARDHARLALAIWDDDDFRTLSGNAQHLYLVLLMHPDLTHCGVTDWRPAKLAGMVGDWSADTVREAAAELIDRLYIVVDEDTEEVLVRSFVRHDGLMKQPKMATAMTSARATVGSAALRGVIVWELQRLHREQPDLNGWHSEKATALLDSTPVDPSGYPCGNPSGKGSGNPTDEGSGNGSTKGSIKGSGNPKPTPIGKGSTKGSTKGCPTPSSLLLAPNVDLRKEEGVQGEGSETDPPEEIETSPPTLTVVADSTEPTTTRRKPKTPLPEPFELTGEMRAWLREKGVTDADAERETEKFRNDAVANDKRFSEWGRAWQNWILNAIKWKHVTPVPAGQTSEEWEKYQRHLALVQEHNRKTPWDPMRIPLPPGAKQPRPAWDA